MNDLKVSISDQECAVIIGHEGERLIVRIESAPEPETTDEDAEVPVAKLLGVAIATRLTEDPEFVEDMLDWFDEYSEDNPEE